MIEIIGIRKRNGTIEQNFTEIHETIEKQDIHKVRQRFTEGDVTWVDIAYKERISEEDFNNEIALLGIEIDYLKQRKQQYERKRSAITIWMPPVVWLPVPGIGTANDSHSERREQEHYRGCQPEKAGC